MRQIYRAVQAFLKKLIRSDDGIGRIPRRQREIWLLSIECLHRRTTFPIDQRMFRSSKYTRQVLFACLFTACFFVGYAALAAAARWAVSFGFLSCLALAAIFVGLTAIIVRAGVQAMKRFLADDGHDGVVVYPSPVSFICAAAAVWLLIFWDARHYPLAFFGLTAALVLFAVIQACRFNREEGVIVSALTQFAFPLAAPVLAIFVVCMTFGRRPDEAKVIDFQSTGNETGLSDYMEEIDANRRQAQQRRSSGLKAVLSLAIYSIAESDAQKREAILRKREADSELSMSLALLPVVFLVAVRLIAGNDTEAFLERAFTERIFVTEQSTSTYPTGGEDSHHKGAYLDGV